VASRPQRLLNIYVRSGGPNEVSKSLARIPRGAATLEMRPLDAAAHAKVIGSWPRFRSSEIGEARIAACRCLPCRTPRCAVTRLLVSDCDRRQPCRPQDLARRRPRELPCQPARKDADRQRRRAAARPATVRQQGRPRRPGQDHNTALHRGLISGGLTADPCGMLNLALAGFGRVTAVGQSATARNTAQRRSRRSSRRSPRSSRRSSRRSWRRPTPWATTAVVPTTAAVRATGAPMTPRRAARAGRSMSVPFLGSHFGLDRCGDRLDRNPAGRDQLAP
jgi:hypothetical protein